MEIVVDTTEQQDITRNVFVKHILGLFLFTLDEQKIKKEIELLQNIILDNIFNLLWL